MVAPNEWAAIRAAATLKAKWTEWNGPPTTDQPPKVVREGKIATEQPGVTRGDAKTAMAGAAKRFGNYSPGTRDMHQWVRPAQSPTSSRMG